MNINKLTKAAEQFVRFAEDPSLLMTPELAEDLAEEKDGFEPVKDNVDEIAKDNEEDAVVLEAEEAEEKIELADQLEADINPEEIAVLDGQEPVDDSSSCCCEEHQEHETANEPSGQMPPSDFFESLKSIMKNIHSPAIEKLVPGGASKEEEEISEETIPEAAAAEEDEDAIDLLNEEFKAAAFDESLNIIRKASTEAEQLAASYDSFDPDEFSTETSEPTIEQEEKDSQSFIMNKMIDLTTSQGFENPEQEASERLDVLHHAGASDEQIEKVLDEKLSASENAEINDFPQDDIGELGQEDLPSTESSPELHSKMQDLLEQWSAEEDGKGQKVDEPQNVSPVIASFQDAINKFAQQYDSIEENDPLPSLEINDPVDPSLLDDSNPSIDAEIPMEAENENQEINDIIQEVLSTKPSDENLDENLENNISEDLAGNDQLIDPALNEPSFEDDE